MKLAIFLYVYILICKVEAILRCSYDNYNCPASAPCCSIHGYCGATFEYCSPMNCIKGCGSSTPAHHWRASGVLDFQELLQMKKQGVESQCKNPRHAALTYDDGIHPTFTPVLLDTLKSKDVKATFFILGKSISRYQDFSHWSSNPHYSQNRETLRRMVKDGHTLASHTFDHTVLPGTLRESMKNQMKSTADLIKDATGYYPRLMRAPEGKLSRQVLKRLRHWHYKAIHWTADTLDWMYQHDPDHIIRFIKYEIPDADDSTAGPIILQHDIFHSTIQVQDRVIDELRSKGYEIVPMDVCLGIDSYHHYK